MLTKKRQTEIQTYVDVLQPILCLRDWKLTVANEPVEDENDAATIRCIYGTHHAYINIGVSFDDHTPEQQRHLLVHELIHPHLNRIKGAVINVLNQGGRTEYEVGKAQLVDECEYATDSLADALAPFCPLPQWA